MRCLCICIFGIAVVMVFFSRFMLSWRRVRDSEREKRNCRHEILIDSFPLVFFFAFSCTSSKYKWCRILSAFFRPFFFIRFFFIFVLICNSANEIFIFRKSQLRTCNFLKVWSTEDSYAWINRREWNAVFLQHCLLFQSYDWRNFNDEFDMRCSQHCIVHINSLLVEPITEACKLQCIVKILSILWIYSWGGNKTSFHLIALEWSAASSHFILHFLIGVHSFAIIHFWFCETAY